MKSKFIEWIKRYGPPEIVATITAVLGASTAFFITKNSIVTAYAGTICENLGFYITIIIIDVSKSIVHHKNNVLKYGARAFLKDVRNLILEFGPAEFLDTLVIRPALMFIFPKIIGNLAIGIFIGKITADITFYLPTIIAYELKKKYLKN